MHVLAGAVSILLRFADSCVEFKDSDELRSFLQYQPQGFLDEVTSKLAVYTEAHGHVFDLGIIECQRLVEVLVPPFLKLVAKINESLPESDSLLRTVCDKRTPIWLEYGIDSHPVWGLSPGWPRRVKISECY